MNDAQTQLAKAIFERDTVLARRELEAGADPNARYTNYTYVELATFQGVPDILTELISAGGRVEANSLTPLGQMDITDWMINSDEDEERYAKIARILIAHGAKPIITASNGSELIEAFPLQYYPKIHQVLAGAKLNQAEQTGKTPNTN